MCVTINLERWTRKNVKKRVRETKKKRESENNETDGHSRWAAV